MRTRRMTAYAAAALLGTAAVTCAPVASAVASGVARPATVPYKDYVTGYGPTLAAAESDARNIINTTCNADVVHLLSDGQESNGTWWADMVALCTLD